MNKHVALMTWHHTENYGTAYQAYAMQRLLALSGCTTDLVEYRRIGTSPLARRNLLSKLSALIHFLFNKRRIPELYKFSEKTFGTFWNSWFNYTEPCNYNQDFRKLNTIYDGFVCGSDQIWGPEWFDARYFLDFVEDEGRLIAYSPSLGVSQLEDGVVKDEMKKLIDRFHHLSLREETGCRIVRQLTGRKDVVNTLDPVLTLPVDEWKGIEEPVNGLPTKYFFIFFLKNNDVNIKKSINAAKEMGYTPIVLHCTQSGDTPYANTGDLTPGQLLTYLKNADYVCTDSFHMTVLSIIYEKNFKVFKKNADNDKTSKNNRITDLLNRLEITNGEYDDDRSFDSKIDYDAVKPRLESLRKDSLEYLKNAINSLPFNEGEEIEEMNCEIEASKTGNCQGECSDTFSEYGKKLNGYKRILYYEMAKYPFALKEKCYRCKYYHSCGNIGDKRKPLFWDDLNTDFKNKSSILHIFEKYYLSYHISSSINKIK